MKPSCEKIHSLASTHAVLVSNQIIAINHNCYRLGFRKKSGHKNFTRGAKCEAN